MDYYPQFGFVLLHSSGPKLVIVVEDVLFVLSSDLWMCIMHPQQQVCSDFILCFWEYFISLKASIFLLPVSITVIQSFILMAPRETFVRRIDRGENVCWSQINGFILGVGLLIKHFFLFHLLDGNEFFKSKGWRGAEWTAFFWWTNHSGRNKSVSLERDMEKWVFMIPITTFALPLALIMAVSLIPSQKHHMCTSTRK